MTTAQAPSTQKAPATPFGIQDIEALAAYCKATADQQRLQILRVLSRESFGVLELCHVLGVAQPALSHHLKILAEVDLVETRKQGTSNFYRRALVSLRDPMHALKTALFDAVDELAVTDSQMDRMAEIHAQRREQALEFFQRNAKKLSENQNLIAEYSHYADCLNQILEDETGIHQVVEVGPGDSKLICHLANHYNSVTGLDNAAEMLALARQNVENEKLNNVSLVEGELIDGPENIDLIVLNMVLHHLASPGELFSTAYDKLVGGGRLLIAELTAHDQDWTREACGDLWPGFEADELDTWAEAGGLQPYRNAFLSLKNGFQVQVHLYRKPQTN